MSSKLLKVLGAGIGLVYGGPTGAAIGAAVGSAAGGGDFKDSLKAGAMAFGIGSLFPTLQESLTKGWENFSGMLGGKAQVAPPAAPNVPIPTKFVDGYQDQPQGTVIDRSNAVVSGSSGATSRSGGIGDIWSGNLFDPKNLLGIGMLAGALEGGGQGGQGVGHTETGPGRQIVYPYRSPYTGLGYMTEAERNAADAQYGYADGGEVNAWGTFMRSRDPYVTFGTLETPDPLPDYAYKGYSTPYYANEELGTAAPRVISSDPFVPVADSLMPTPDAVNPVSDPAVPTPDPVAPTPDATGIAGVYGGNSAAHRQNINRRFGNSGMHRQDMFHRPESNPSPYTGPGVQNVSGGGRPEMPQRGRPGFAMGGPISPYGQSANVRQDIFHRPTDPTGASRGLGGLIEGPGTGTSDSIPATIMQNGQPVRQAALSDGEFVMTHGAVRGAGGGDRAKGAANLYRTMKQLEGMA